MSRTCLCVISMLITSTAFAQNNRSAVSVNGSDTSLCTTVSPCRSFGVALAHTNAGGEVIALDSGGYGTFAVTQSVSVIGAPGVHAALTTTGGADGITVAAGSGDSVKIRGLNITVTAGSSYGINATTFGALSIENCSVSGGSSGIFIAGGAASHATVVDSVVRGGSTQGYWIFSPASLVRCRAEKNGGVGLLAGQGTADGIVTAVDFVSVANFEGAGVYNPTAGHNVFLNLDHALISNNSTDGVFALSNPSAGGTVMVTNSTATNNGGYGFTQSGSATFGSMNNNLVNGNGAGETFGVISIVPLH